uniref:Ig-like domain-containing protein n=1 Tax=Strigops habroptila TaxID=2489341 RepID=A0A672UN21_STRHB
PALLALLLALIDPPPFPRDSGRFLGRLDELRPASIHGMWYFGSPYPKNYPPVVARSRPGAVHESFTGRAVLLGDPGIRDCSLLLGPLSTELAGKYYFRGDLGGYNQYSFSEHATLEGPSEAVEGSALELGCSAEGRPPPLLSWFRGAAVLREEPGASSLELPLPRLTPGDAGTYVCVAENRHGSHNRSLQLHVAWGKGGMRGIGGMWACMGYGGYRGYGGLQGTIGGIGGMGVYRGYRGYGGYGGYRDLILPIPAVPPHTPNTANTPLYPLHPQYPQYLLYPPYPLYLLYP